MVGDPHHSLPTDTSATRRLHDADVMGDFLSAAEGPWLRHVRGRAIIVPANRHRVASHRWRAESQAALPFPPTEVPCEHRSHLAFLPSLSLHALTPSACPIPVKAPPLR